MNRVHLTAWMAAVAVGLLGCEYDLDTAAFEPLAREAGPGYHIVEPIDQIDWRDGPVGLPPGSEFAVLEGDPAEPEIFTMYLRLPDGYVIPPHWHPNVERVTVLRGTFHLGHGSRFDADATQALPAGSYTSMPAGMEHFAFAEGETMLQLTSIGPWEIEYIDPADDPRLE